MRTLERNTIAIRITGVGIVHNNALDAWALFAPLASSSLLLKGALAFYLYLYLYWYGNDRW
ncbi:MAG: hypothetical protein OXI63_08410 [Candidatus Poribacteria bacterium]|nr:hypothetical protein [Candidatus Poribacteria bacterium]